MSPFNTIRSVFDQEFNFERLLFYYVSGLYLDKLIDNDYFKMFEETEENKKGVNFKILILNRHFYSTFAYTLAYASREEEKAVFQILNVSPPKKKDLYILLRPSIPVLLSRLRERVSRLNSEEYHDKKLEKLFIDSKKHIEKLYEKFYIELPIVLLPKISENYFILPNNTLKDLENNVEFISNIIKSMVTG